MVHGSPTGASVPSQLASLPEGEVSIVPQRPVLHHTLTELPRPSFEAARLEIGFRKLVAGVPRGDGRRSRRLYTGFIESSFVAASFQRIVGRAAGRSKQVVSKASFFNFTSS
jgi:hypothetical protein